jgi:anti-repressor protein
MNEVRTFQPFLLSSRAIAEITGKKHADVMRDMRTTLEQVDIDHSKFAGVYLGGNGQNRACYHLPRRECDLVVSGYSAKYRLAIIDRWQELETRAKQPFQIPATHADALRLAADLMERFEEVAPKIEYFDRVAKSESVCQMAVAAQVARLPFGRNTLFEKLRTMGVLFKGGERHNLPKQQYIAQGLFTVSQRIVDHPRTGEPIVSQTTHVTQKGLAWIIARFSAAAVNAELTKEVTG